ELKPPRVGTEARPRHGDARRTALAVGDQRDVADAGVDRRHRVLDVGDERAAADLRPVDVARADAHVLGGLGAHPEAGAEDGIDVVFFEPRIGERVPRRFGVERERGLPGELPVLVRLARADDRDAAAHAAEIAAHAGRKRGSATSAETSSNTTSTGMPILIFAGSGSTPTRFVIRRGPSASSTIAITYGVGSGKPFCPRCTTVKVWTVPRPLMRSHARSTPKQCGHAARG